LCRRLNGSNGYKWYHQLGFVGKVGTVCVRQVSDTLQHDPIGAVWNDVTLNLSGTVYKKSEIVQQDITDAITACENEVAVEALTSYDALTDIAEARDIPQLVNSISSELTKLLKVLHGRYSISDLRSASRLSPLDLLKHSKKVFRKLGEDWMRHRYGIMPLVYSYRDIMKLMKRGEHNTTRKMRNVYARETGTQMPSSTSQYLWSQVSGGTLIRATVFQQFDWRGGSLAAGVGFNPLVTAWELIPYSFVVDWFVDVGTYITRKTTRPSARTTYACISQRSDYTTETYYHFKQDNKTVTYTNRLSDLWVGTTPPAAPSRTIPRPEESQLVKTIHVDSYRRWLFYLGDAQLIPSPSLNWRRLVDSAVMAVNNLGALSRHLK